MTDRDYFTALLVQFIIIGTFAFFGIYFLVIPLLVFLYTLNHILFSAFLACLTGIMSSLYLLRNEERIVYKIVHDPSRIVVSRDHYEQLMRQTTYDYQQSTSRKA